MIDKSTTINLDFIRELPIRFYTLPPIRVVYPFIIINLNRPNDGLRYIKKHYDKIESIIIDSGIEVFKNGSKDYPGGYKTHTNRLVRMYYRVRSLCPNSEVYVTCPDYPDTFTPKQLWLSEEITNIERTVESILWCTKKFRNVDWLIPLQVHYNRPDSIIRSIKLLVDSGFEFENYDYYATPTKSRKVKDIVNLVLNCISELRRYRKNFKLHLFGLYLKAVPEIVRLRFVNISYDRGGLYSGTFNDVMRRGLLERYFSFDSSSYTKPVGDIVLKVVGAKKRFSCKSEVARVTYFLCYISRLCEMCNRYDFRDKILEILGISRRDTSIESFFK